MSVEHAAREQMLQLKYSLPLSMARHELAGFHSPQVAPHAGTKSAPSWHQVPDTEEEE